jgi:stage IV sporulation protein FB
MGDRLGNIGWSLPLGRLFHTQLRLSPLCLVVPLILGIRLGWSVGLALSVLLFVFLIVHEFGHVFAARLTGGMADDIIIWPLGGLAAVQPGPGLNAALKTIAAGPLINLAFAALFYPGFYAPELLWGVLNPFEVPVSELGTEDWRRSCLLLAFLANWILFLVNLLPLLPLDGGRILAASLTTRMPEELAHRLMASIGVVLSLALMFTGLAINHAWLVAIGAIPLVMNLLLAMQLQGDDVYDESFMGYDFSQGYTSLERNADPSETTLKPGSPGWFAAWKAERRKRQAVAEAERRAELERELDRLLVKVHEEGMDALSAAEKRLLREASEELRGRTKRPEA